MSSLCVNFWRSYASLWTENIGNTQFSALFSYMLWYIELKFCIWFCFSVLQIKYECRHFASIFEGVMHLCELRKYAVFRTFSYMLWDIELKFCIWLCFNVLQIKFKRCHSASLWLSTVHHTCLLYAIDIWAEILNLTLVSLMRFF